MKKFSVIMMSLLLSSIAVAEISIATSFVTTMSDRGGPRKKMLVEAQPYAIEVALNDQMTAEAASVYAQIRAEIPEAAQLTDSQLTEAIIQISNQK